MEPLPGVCSRIPVNGLGMSCTLQVRSIALDQVSCTERLGGTRNDEWILVLTSAISGDRCGLVGPEWGERSRAPLIVSAKRCAQGSLVDYSISDWNAVGRCHHWCGHGGGDPANWGSRHRRGGRAVSLVGLATTRPLPGWSWVVVLGIHPVGGRRLPATGV
jgi:hypothetical protein